MQICKWSRTILFRFYVLYIYSPQKYILHVKPITSTWIFYQANSQFDYFDSLHHNLKCIKYKILNLAELREKVVKMNFYIGSSIILETKSMNLYLWRKILVPDSMNLNFSLSLMEGDQKIFFLSSYLVNSNLEASEIFFLSLNFIVEVK